MNTILRVLLLIALSFNVEASWFSKGLSAYALPINVSKKNPGLIGVTYHIDFNCVSTFGMFGTKKLLGKHTSYFTDKVNVTAIVDGHSVSGDFTVKETKLGDLAPGGEHDNTPMLYMYGRLHDDLLSRLQAGKTLALVIDDARYATSLDGFTAAVNDAYATCQKFQ